MKSFLLSESNIIGILKVAYVEGLLQGHKNERAEKIEKPVEIFAQEYAEKELARLKNFLTP
jgi:hypothetical protein